MKANIESLVVSQISTIFQATNERLDSNEITVDDAIKRLYGSHDTESHVLRYLFPWLDYTFNVDVNSDDKHSLNNYLSRSFRQGPIAKTLRFIKRPRAFRKLTEEEKTYSVLREKEEDQYENARRLFSEFYQGDIRLINLPSIFQENILGFINHIIREKVHLDSLIFKGLSEGFITYSGGLKRLDVQGAMELGNPIQLLELSAVDIDESAAEKSGISSEDILSIRSRIESGWSKRYYIKPRQGKEPEMLEDPVLIDLEKSYVQGDILGHIDIDSIDHIVLPRIGKNNTELQREFIERKHKMVPTYFLMGVGVALAGLVNHYLFTHGLPSLNEFLANNYPLPNQLLDLFHVSSGTLYDYILAGIDLLGMDLILTKFTWNMNQFGKKIESLSDHNLDFIFDAQVEWTNLEERYSIPPELVESVCLPQEYVRKFAETVGYYINFKPGLGIKVNNPKDKEEVLGAVDKIKGKPEFEMIFLDSLKGIIENYEVIGKILDCSKGPFRKAVYLDGKPSNFIDDIESFKDELSRPIDKNHSLRYTHPLIDVAKFISNPVGEYNSFSNGGLEVNLERVADMEFGKETLEYMGTKGSYPTSHLMYVSVNFNQRHITNKKEMDLLRKYLKKYIDHFNLPDSGDQRYPENEYTIHYRAAMIDVNLRNIGYSQKRNPDDPNLLFEQMFSAMSAFYHIHRLSVENLSDFAPREVEQLRCLHTTTKRLVLSLGTEIYTEHGLKKEVVA